MECCGASGPNDWALSKYNSKETSNIINMKISSSSMHYKIPESCCKSHVDPEQCTLSTKVSLKSIISSDVYSLVRKLRYSMKNVKVKRFFWWMVQGCTDKLVSEFHANIRLVCAIASGILIAEFLGLMFALTLYCAVKNKENYKS